MNVRRDRRQSTHMSGLHVRIDLPADIRSNSTLADRYLHRHAARWSLPRLFRQPSYMMLRGDYTSNRDCVNCISTLAVCVLRGVALFGRARA